MRDGIDDESYGQIFKPVSTFKTSFKIGVVALNKRFTIIPAFL